MSNICYLVDDVAEESFEVKYVSIETSKLKRQRNKDWGKYFKTNKKYPERISKYKIQWKS